MRVAALCTLYLPPQLASPFAHYLLEFKWRPPPPLVCLFPGLMEILPDRCSAIAKKELVYAGTVGLICWLGGIVFINRKKTSDAKSVMADTAKVMLNDQVTG